MTRRTGFSDEVKKLIRDRAQNLCERCAQHTDDCVAHHRRPRGLGGSRREDTNLASNGLWLCRVCHNVVETQRGEALILGQLVLQSHCPAEVPVLRRGVLVLLDDLGGWRREVD